MTSKKQTLVAMATKFGTKWVITSFVWEISPRCLCRVGVLGVRLLNDVRQILPRPTPVAMVTKFETKNGHISACEGGISEILALSRGFSWSGY